MKMIGEGYRYLMRNVLEPGLQLVVDHPIITVICVVVLIYWAVRGYRTI